MIRASSNFSMLQQRLQSAARRFAEARAKQPPATDNAANWRSARWLWPQLGQE